MSARQQPEQPQMGPVPLARMEQWFNLKQEQDNTRSEFERRVADARRQLLERHAHEQQAFWTGQPCVAWQPPANADSLGRTPNGQVATPPRQQAPQRPVDQAPPPGPRPPARNAGNPAQNHLKAPANAPNKVAAKAVPPTATPARTPAAAQRQSKPAAKSAPKPRSKIAPKKQDIEVVDLCSDEENKQSRPTTTASGQRVELNPPHPSGVLSFFGDSSEVFRSNVKDEEDPSNRQFPTSSNVPVPVNAPVGPTQVSARDAPVKPMPIQNRPNNRGMEPGTAIPSPVQRESLMLQGRQTQLRHEMQMGLNSSSDHLGEQSIKPSDSFSRPQQQQQQKQLFASDTLHRHGGQNRAPRLEKACERSEEDVDMKDALAEAEQPEPGPNMLHRSHNPGAKMPDRQHAHTDADKADRDARAEYEKQRQRFLAIMQTNGRLPAAEQAQWIEINEAELKRRKERERTLKNLRTVEKHNEPNSNVRDHCVEGEVDKPSRIQGSVECSQVQVHTTTDCQRPQQASVDEYAAEKQRREQHQDDVSAKGVDPSLHRPSHQALDRSQPLTQFKVPQVPSRAALINDRSRREETITSRASSQTLPGNSTAATDKARLNLLLLTPPNSEVSPTRKRKVIHNVSDDSDDDPEFEPPSSDDEPLLNRIRKPVVKKAKAVNGSGTAKPVSVTPKFGFKSVKRTKSNRPITPARATGKTTAPSARSKSSERALGSESPSVQAALRLHHRRAKQKALAALDEHFQRDVEFRNEEDIRKANEREQRVANSLPKTMKRVSLMPVPPSARLASGRKETSGSQEADGEVDNAVRKERKDSAYGLAHWTKDRIRGDRHLLKSQSVSSRGRGDEESESELDLSAYQWVNGRIVTQSEEMDMAEDSR